MVIEAEHFHERTPRSNGDHWHVVPDDDFVDQWGDFGDPPFSNAWGGKYIQMLPDNGGGIDGPEGQPWADYRVHIQTVGTYRLYLRWRGHNGNSDSMFASVVEQKDGAGGLLADWYEYAGGSSANFNGSWRANAGFEMNAASAPGDPIWDITEPGVYTIRLTYREDGVAVDALAFQLTSVAPPTDAGPAESPISTDYPPAIVGRVPGFGGRGVFPDTGIEVQIKDGGAGQVDASSVAMQLDGNALSPVTSSKAGDVTTAKWAPTGILTAGSVHTVLVSFKDSAANEFTSSWQFTVENYATLTPDLARPAGTVDTGAAGFNVFVHQATTSGGTLANNTLRGEDQLRGRLLDPVTGQPYPNLAIGGPAFTDADVINWNQDAGFGAEMGNFQFGSTPSTPDEPIPGIPGLEGSTDNIAAEIIGFLDLKAGLHRFGVNSDDGFRVTSAVNPRDMNGLELGLYSGGRGSADSLFSVLVEQAGLYPVRLIWYGGTSAANLEFFTVDLPSGTKLLVNDRTQANAVRSYRASSLALPPMLNQARPTPYAANVNATSAIFAELLDQDTQVDPSTVQLQVNGATVNATATKTGGSTTVLYDPPRFLPSAATTQILLTAKDNTGATHQYPWRFGVQDYATFPVLPPGFKVPAGSIDLAKAGFRVKVHQMEVARPGGNNLPDPEIQLDPGFTKPATGQPYDNLIDTFVRGPVDAQGYFAIDTVVNWEQAADGFGGGPNAGNFNPNDQIPGIPGIFGSNDHIAAETLTFLELARGVYRMGVNCDDGFKVTAAQHVRDLFITQLGVRSPGGGATDTLFNFVVEEAGIYPFRLLWWEGTGGANVEWFVDDADTGQRILVNDRSNARAVKAYRAYTGTAIPYVKSVQPRIGETVVPADTTIEAVLANLGGGTVGLYVDGVQITPTIGAVGGDSRVVYTPPNPLSPGATVTVGLTYGSVSNSWTFTVAKGPKVLFVVANSPTLGAGDAAFLDRLTLYGFDTLIVGDTPSQTSDADHAVLVVTSSTVGSGNVATKFRDVAVPVLNWEQALQDDYLMTLNGDGVDRGGQADQQQVNIQDASHPMAAGLAAGNHAVTIQPTTFSWGVPAPTAKVIATLTDGVLNTPCIYGYEKGALLIDGVTPAPARRVQVFLGDTTYPILTDAGVGLIDAALSWAMNRPLVPQQDSRFNPLVWVGGNVTISWTGPGTLQEAPTVTGPWTDAANQNNPQTTAASGPAKFYRLKQ